MQKSVAHILEEKGADVWSVAPDATVYAALELMAERGIGALPVMEDDALVGILSERDYARKVILFERESKDTRVREIMTHKVYTVTPQDTVAECMALMTELRVRHLPVLEEGRVVGVISIGDVVLAVISEQEFMIKELEKYIKG